MNRLLGLTWGGLSKIQYISNDGIELQTSTERFRQKLVKTTADFEYINSLLVKETHDTIFQKKTFNIPVDNGSSLNIPITIKIIALTNRTLIETSVLVV
jgi:precorrin isomerase